MAKRISPSGTLFSFSFTKTPAKKSRNGNEEEESTEIEELVDVDRVDQVTYLVQSESES